MKEDPQCSNVVMDKYLGEPRRDHDFDVVLVLGSSQACQALLSMWTYQNEASIRVETNDMFELRLENQKARVATFFGTIDGI